MTLLPATQQPHRAPLWPCQATGYRMGLTGARVVAKARLGAWLVAYGFIYPLSLTPDSLHLCQLILKMSLWLFWAASAFKWVVEKNTTVGKTPWKTLPKGVQLPYRENRPDLQTYLFQLSFFFPPPPPNMCSSYCCNWNQLVEGEPSRVSQLES